MAISPLTTIRVIAQQQDVNGSLIQNVFFFKHTGTTDVDEAVFLTAVESELSLAYAEMEDYIPNTCDPTTILCDIVGFVGGVIKTLGTVGEIAWTSWSGGTGTGEGLPQGCAAVSNFTTLSPGVLGRKYVGPLTEGSQNAGVLIGAAQTALAAFAAEILDGFLASSQQFDQVLMSTRFALAIDVAGAVVKSIIGYQRRRKSGVGA